MDDFFYMIDVLDFCVTTYMGLLDHADLAFMYLPPRRTFLLVSVCFDILNSLFDEL